MQLMLAWAAFQSLSALALAESIKSRLGNSNIAENWGELITARDIWEVMEHGNSTGYAMGFWPTVLGLAALAWALWAGWKMQAKAAALKAKFLPWAAAAPIALAIGWLPLWLLHAPLWNALSYMGGLGIQFLGWADLIAGPLLRMTFASSLMLQWWLCRLDLTHGMPKGAKEWLAHLRRSFLRLWSHPVQWGSIIFFGASFRAGLAFGVLALAMEWGGQGLPRLWALVFFQAMVAAVNAWAIGWAMRVAALYWQNDAEVRCEIALLESSVRYFK
jgi:hypothetical protein